MPARDYYWFVRRSVRTRLKRFHRVREMNSYHLVDKKRTLSTFWKIKKNVVFTHTRCRHISLSGHPFQEKHDFTKWILCVYNVTPTDYKMGCSFFFLCVRVGHDFRFCFFLILDSNRTRR